MKGALKGVQFAAYPFPYNYFFGFFFLKGHSGMGIATLRITQDTPFNTDPALCVFFFGGVEEGIQDI